MEILHELFVQVITVIFMAGVIVLAVFLGHKFRDFKDQKKTAKADQEQQGGTTENSVGLEK